MASKKEKQSSRSARKCAEVGRIFLREELRAQYRRVNQIMKKPESERSEEEKEVLAQSQDMVKDIEKRTKLRELSKQRKLEIEDPADVLKTKCTKLAKVIQEAKNLVVYTGAGISTAASIPDYRGPNGVWTLLQQGIQPKAQDLTDSVPTYTHQCLTVLHQNGLVKYVVSQNCDGLHVRSGLDRMALSELHGNMFIEMCMACSPPVEYIRLFDVTEKTGLRKHKTGRFCSFCGSELRDTIVHFGEKGNIGPPHNWNDAAKFVDSADVLLCLGSSLKVLKNYPCLWHSHKPSSRRAKLYIVNLQWTPKDDSAEMKINGRCDDVMKLVMEQLGLDILQYSMMNDPIFYLATPLLKSELDTVHKKLLVEPSGYSRKQMEQRYGPRCYTFPSYVHPNSLHQQGKQWKARKTKPSVPIKKPTVTRKRDVKELRKKALKEQPKRSAIVRRAKPDMVTSPKVKNGKSKLAMSAIMKTNGIKKSRRIKKENTQIPMEDESVKTDEDAASVKHSPKSSDTSQKDDPELDSSDTMAGVSSRGSEGNVCDEELKQEVEEFVVKNEDKKNETWLKEECKAEEDAIGISAYDEKLKDVENMDSLLDDVIGDGHVIEDYARSLETATDGTIALSRESEDSRTEGAGKASNSPTHGGSLLKDCSTTAMSVSSVDNVQGQRVASTPVSKDVGEAALESGSGTNVPAGCPLSLLSIDVSSLPARSEISNSLQDHNDSDVSLRQLYSDVNLGQDQIGHQLKENNPEELQSYLKPNDSSTTVSSSSSSNSSTNPHLSSPASVQAHTQPIYQGGGTSASCVPGGGYVLAQPNSSRPATTNVGSVHAITTQSQTGLSCTSVMNSQTVTDLNECTTMEVRHLRLPHIPVIQNLQMAAGQHSSASNNLVTTSQNSSARTVTTSTPVPMVTMTVSEYLSSISLKRAAVATTTTTNSHHVSPSAYVQGSSTDHSSQLHVSVKPPVTQNQPSQTMAPNPVYATQSVPKVSALQIRPAVLLSPGNLIASAPSGYVQHALFTTAQASGTQTTVSTAATTGANLMTYNRAQHMQLPVQLPTQPSAAAPAVSTVTTPVNTTIGAAEQKRKSKGKVGKESVMPSGSTQTTLQQAAEEQRSPTKRKASVSPQLTSSKTSRVKSPTNVQALAASKAPLGSPDPAVYKYLSECLMRNIQLITGLHVMPLPQSGSLPQTDSQSLGNALSTTPSIVNSVTQIITSPMLQTTTVVKSKGARTKKQKSSKSASEAPQPPAGGTMSMSSAAMTCASHSVIAEPVAQLQQSEAQTLVAQATTLPNAIVTSLVGAQPTQQQQTGALPAHQPITETQQAAGNLSPAHQGASHYILNPAFQQMAAADPGHVAAVQQMMALKGFGSQHPMTSMPQTTSGSKDLANIADAQQVLLASTSDYTALLQNINQSQQQIVSTAPAMSQAVVSLPPKQSNQSTVSCPNIVAALGKPPSHSGWPVTPNQGVSCGQQAMYAVQNATANEGKTSEYLVNEQNSVNHVIADHQTDSASAAQNPEALKKSLHIKKILAHLQKATPGAPLPPYMYDNKTQPTTSNQEVAGLPSGSQSLQGQQQVTEMVQHHKAMAGLQHGSAIQDPNAKNVVTATQMLHTAALADGQYSVNSGQLPWHQPVMTTGALSLGGSAPASLLSASLQGKALSDTSNQSGLQGVTPVSSLSHSTSFDSMHSQVASSEDSNVLMSQFNNQLNQSPDPDICYETYLINDSVTAEEESSALQQAQAAAFQQLGYRNDTADDAQAVVVMDTQEVAFLDDIECEIEIQDGESLPEPSITEGIVDDVSVLTADSTAHTALADVQTTQNTGPPVYTEAVPEQTPDDGQIGQLGMRLSDDVDLAVAGTNMWDAQHPGPAQLVSANPGQVALDVNQVASEPKQAQEQARSAPGWFGKGLHVKKPRRKRAK